MGTCSPGHFAQIRVLELSALKTRSRKFHRHPWLVFTRSFSSRFDLTSQPDWLARMKGDDGEIIENPEYAINCPLVDLANHGTNIKLLCWSGYDNNSKKMHLKTHKKIKQGTELCINYGFGKFNELPFHLHTLLDLDAIDKFDNDLQVNPMMNCLPVTVSVINQASIRSRAFGSRQEMFSIHLNHQGSWHFGRMQSVFSENTTSFISLSRALLTISTLTLQYCRVQLLLKV